MASDTSLLSEQLDDLSAALNNSRNLFLMAEGCRSLVDKKYSPLCKPYTDVALQKFEASLEYWGDDPDLIHHLAVAHHARAWDLELAGSSEAPEAWRKALKYWNKVRITPEFWKRLKKKGEEIDKDFDVAAVKNMREQLGVFLLEVHLDFIREYYDQNKNKHAEAHILVVRDAHLPPAVRKQMDKRLYEAVTDGVREMLDCAKFQNAADTIKRFLNLLPDYLPAQSQLVEIYYSWMQTISIIRQWDEYHDFQEDIFPVAEQVGARVKVDESHEAILAHQTLSSFARRIGHDYHNRAVSMCNDIGKKLSENEINDMKLFYEINNQALGLEDIAVRWLELAYYDECERVLCESLANLLAQRAQILLIQSAVIESGALIDTWDGSVTDIVERFCKESEVKRNKAIGDLKRAISLDPENGELKKELKSAIQ